jgi:hypothetical protein
MAEMEVVIIDKFGSREVMKFRKLPIPTPGPNEILLKVKAASINPVDWKIREGKFPAIKPDKLPYVLGREKPKARSSSKLRSEIGGNLRNARARSVSTFRRCCLLLPTE